MSQVTESPGARRFWRHAGGLGVVGAILALAIGAAFMSIGSDQRPRDLPIAAVGSPAMAKALEAQAPGELSVRAVPDLATAKQEIAERDVYGAVVLGPNGVQDLYVAQAANNGAANTLRKTLGQPTEAGVPRITDVKPLPAEDGGGVDLSLIITVLIIGGSIAVVGIGKLLPRIEGDPRHGVLPLTFLAGYAVISGLALAGITEAFGVGGDSAFVDRFLAMSLISFAVAASTAGLVALIGPAGSAVASILYFVLGAQISGAGAAPEFLPSFWSDLGQHLPGGAGVSLLRDLFYFPDASTGEPIWILAAYAAAGLVVLLALTAVRARASMTSRARLEGSYA